MPSLWLKYLLVPALFLAPFARAEEKEKPWNFYGSYGEARVQALDGKHDTSRYGFGGDAFLPLGITGGLELGGYNYPLGPDPVKNSEFTARAGLNLLWRRLQVMARWSTVSVKYGDFSGSTKAKGAEAVYRLFLTKSISLQFMGIWTKTDSVTVESVKVTPSTNAAENYFCTLVTLGLVKTCSNTQTKTLNLSGTTYASLSLALGIMF